MHEELEASQESNASQQPADIDWGKLTEKVLTFRKKIDKLEKKDIVVSCKRICMNKWQCVCIYIYIYVHMTIVMCVLSEFI